jgi:hypothetical protein
MSVCLCLAVPHDDGADEIVNMCIDATWKDEEDVSVLKMSIAYELQNGGSREAIDFILGGFRQI